MTTEITHSPASVLPSRLRYLVDVATMTAEYSKCGRAHVGCVIADTGLERFVVGTNGGPRGGTDGCIRDAKGNCGCLHAELNALAKVADPGPKVAVLTLQPCYNCAVLLRNANVVSVFYTNEYRDQSGVDMLRKLGVQCIHVEPDETLRMEVREPYRQPD